MQGHHRPLHHAIGIDPVPGLNLSTMLMGDAVGNRQAQAGPPGATGHKRLKDMRQHVWGEPRATVADLHLYP